MEIFSTVTFLAQLFLAESAHRHSHSLLSLQSHSYAGAVTVWAKKKQSSSQHGEIEVFFQMANRLKLGVTDNQLSDLKVWTYSMDVSVPRLPWKSKLKGEGWLLSQIPQYYSGPQTEKRLKREQHLFEIQEI